MRASAIPWVPLMLAACLPVDQDIPGAPGGSCRAEQFQYLVGLPAGAFNPVGLEGPVRIIRPDDAVTMDFNPRRLNVELGGDGRIMAVRCG